MAVGHLDLNMNSCRDALMHMLRAASDVISHTHKHDGNNGGRRRRTTTRTRI